MIDDLIHESNIFDILHIEDCRIINSARGTLKKAPLNEFLQGDLTERIWFDENIKNQEGVLSLKTRIDFLLSKKKLEYFKLEGECLESGEYEFIKVRDERVSTMLYKTSQLCDIKISIEQLSCLSSYLEGLLWSLRDLMKLFKK